ARALAEVAPEAAHVFRSGADGPGREADSREWRDRTIEAMAEAIRDVSRTRSVALAVDDVDRIDEESLATLALLSSSTENRRLLILATVETGKARPTDAAFSLLLSSSTSIELTPFSTAETRELLSSLFGEVPNLDLLAEVAQTETRGFARELLDGAQGLVDRGLASYAGGAWTIGGDPGALSRALAQSTDAAKRLESLTPDGRALAAVLALDRDAILSLAEYPDIAFEGHRARAYQALTAVLQSGLCALEEDKCRFTREADRVFVESALPESEARAVHGRLAEHTSRCANAIYPAYHYFLAGDPELAARWLDAFRDFLAEHPAAPIIRQPIVLDTVERMLESEAPFGRAFRAEHGAGMIMNAVYLGVPERAAPHVAHALAELSWLTALDDFHERTDVEPSQRLGMAFALSQSRCAEARGIDPIAALRRLCQLGVMTTICARFMADPSLLRALPDLSPFAPLSPAVAFAMRLIEGLSLLVRGSHWEARRAIRAVYLELKGAGGESMDLVTRLALGGTALAQLCALEAESAVEGTLEHLEELAAFVPNLTESCRARYYLALGMTQESEAARRKAERLSVQATGLAEARISELAAYLTFHALSDDVLGLKRTFSAMKEVLKTRPGWKYRVALAESHLLRCRGDFARALSTIESVLGELSPDNGDWAPCAALHVTLLDLTGRTAHALGKGDEYLEAARRHGVPHAGIALSLALAHAHRSDGESAERHVALARSELESHGVNGVYLGYCFEVGARVASLRGDRDTFAERAACCAGLYRHGDNPVLTARYDELLRADRIVEARSAANVDQAATVIVGRTPRGTPLGSSSSARSYTSVGSDAHADALGLLVERSGARGGFLYVRGGDGWSRVYGTPGLRVPRDLDAAILEQMTEIEEPATECAEAAPAHPEHLNKSWAIDDAEGGRLISCLLADEGARPDRVVAIAVLSMESDAIVDIPTTSLAAAARALVPEASLAL
ncbi:MAG TPA: hypothetical protein VHU80_10795, partial [Polyangiaceae bacterium]|nr:hypothetical protein [Polyangiaceae bacterium]